MNSTTGSAAASDHAGLLQAVAANQDIDAFQALFTWYAPRIKSVMRRQGADEVMAEELSQETLLMVWRKSHLFDPTKAGPSTWIFTIARNLRIDRFRKENRPELDPNDPALVPEGEQQADVALETKDREKLSASAYRHYPKTREKLYVCPTSKGLRIQRSQSV